MTPAQKSAAVAQIGIQGFKFSDGSTLATKVIPGTENAPGAPPLTVAKGVSLMAQGVNVPSLAKNYKQLSSIQQAVGSGPVTPDTIATTAKNAGLLGFGKDGGVVPVNVQSLAQSGYTSVGAYGVGAIQGPLNAPAPKGYSILSTDTKSNTRVFIPSANASTATPITAVGKSSQSVMASA